MNKPIDSTDLKINKTGQTGQTGQTNQIGQDVSTDRDDSLDSRSRNYVFLVSLLASFLTPFMGSSVNVAIPAIGMEFHLEAAALNWIVTSYLLACTMLLIPLGRAADLYGRKKLFLSGIGLFTVASLLCGLSKTSPLLITVRAVQGIGSAMIFGTGMAIVTSVFPPGERGKVIGWNVATVYAGLSAGPVIGGFLTQHLGWRSLFFCNTILGLATWIVVVWKIKAEWKESGVRSLDWLGSMLYVCGMGGFLYGLAMISSSMHGGVFLTGGIVLLIVFVVQQLRSRTPLLDLSLFRNVVFGLSNLAALIHYSATFAVGYLLSLYLQVGRGQSAQTTGLILLAQPIVMAAISPLSGRLSDRHEPRVLASLGMALTGSGLATLIFLEQQTPLGMVIGILLLMGLGYGLFSSPNTNAVMGSVGREHYGVASSMLATMRLTGGAFSMALVTFFFAFYLKGKPVSPEQAPLLLKSIRLAMIVFSMLCGCGVFASMARGRIHAGKKAGR